MMRCLAVLIIVPMIGCTNPVETNAEESDEIQETGFAVVELFTSQGCSSCPPADALLGELLRENLAAGRNVMSLTFHVDYWNRLGWTDPYSQAAFTARQRAYAKALESNSVYTPQMIVNGQYGFVGSNEKSARKYISGVLKETASVVVKVDARFDSDRAKLETLFDVVGANETHQLNIAVIETEVGNEVPRGENAGRKLAHTNVVRVFQTVDLSRELKGSVTIDLPKELNKDSVAIVAYVQDKTSFKIVGARRILLGKP